MKLSCIVLLAGFFCFGVMNAAVAGECPKTNVLKEMVQTTIKSFAEVSPLDITKIKSSGAFQSKDGKKMAVCLSNGDFTAKELASEWVSPIKKKEDFIFVLQFRNGNDKIAEGEYSAAAGFGKPFWVFSEVRIGYGEKGTTVSFGVTEGTAKIISMKDGKMCGTFDLKAKDDKAHVAGEFNVDITVSKY